MQPFKGKKSQRDLTYIQFESSSCKFDQQRTIQYYKCASIQELFMAIFSPVFELFFEQKAVCVDSERKCYAHRHMLFQCNELYKVMIDLSPQSHKSSLCSQTCFLYSSVVLLSLISLALQNYSVG